MFIKTFHFSHGLWKITLSNISSLLSIKVKKEFRKKNKIIIKRIGAHSVRTRPLYICEKRYRFKITPYTEQLKPRNFFPIFECIRYLNRNEADSFQFRNDGGALTNRTAVLLNFLSFFIPRFTSGWCTPPSFLYILERLRLILKLNGQTLETFLKVESDFFFPVYFHRVCLPTLTRESTVAVKCL